MSDKEYAYSYDEEQYHGWYKTIEEAIEMGNDCCEPGQEFWIGEIVKPSIYEFVPDTEDIIEMMENRAWDEYGDNSQDWFSNPKVGEEQKVLYQQIKDEMTLMFQKYNIEPQFFTIVKAQKYISKGEEGAVRDEYKI